MAHSFSVVFCHIYNRILFPLAFYSTLNCHGIFLFALSSSPFILISLYWPPTLLSTAMAHLFFRLSSQVSSCIYFTLTGLLLYISTVMVHLFWTSVFLLAPCLHNLCRFASQILVFSLNFVFFSPNYYPCYLTEKILLSYSFFYL